jgi:hypothetical protein
MVYRLSLSVVLVSAESILAQSLSLFLTVAWASFVIVRRPFKKSFFTTAVVNCLAMVLVSSFYLYQGVVANESSINFATYVPIALICILGIVCVFNSIVSAVHLYRSHLQKKRI